jgi:hypothetical protein
MTVAESPPDGYQLITATILCHKRSWEVMWVGEPLLSFRVSTLRVGVAYATMMAADFYRENPDAAGFEFAFLIFGRPQPVTEGVQLVVTGDPGQLAATDTRDDSVFHGATLEDLLALTGANPAQPGDYGISWIRPFPAILGVAERELAALGPRKVRYYRILARRLGLR